MEGLDNDFGRDCGFFVKSQELIFDKYEKNNSQLYKRDKADQLPKRTRYESAMKRDDLFEF